MFERGEQIRTQTPFFFAHSIEVPALQQQCEEALSEIFRLFRSNALSSYEPINRSPISAAKFFQCRLCCWGFTLRRQHHAPARGSKRDRAVLRASAHPSQ